jgi:hypothetical protein
VRAASLFPLVLDAASGSFSLSCTTVWNNVIPNRAARSTGPVCLPCWCMLPHSYLPNPDIVTGKLLAELTVVWNNVIPHAGSLERYDLLLPRPIGHRERNGHFQRSGQRALRYLQVLDLSPARDPGPKERPTRTTARRQSSALPPSCCCPRVTLRTPRHVLERHLRATLLGLGVC